MNNDQIQLTAEGLEKLKLEVKELADSKRSLAVERLQKARSMGDLKENSEYAAAKEDLAFVEGRIQEIEEIIKKAVVANTKTNNDFVEIGNKVIIEKDGQKEEYSLVGEFEADPVQKKLSPTSPLGKALLNKKVNDTAEVEAPIGKIQYRIIEIK
jgi:transcription elongation factor GreA